MTIDFIIFSIIYGISIQILKLPLFEKYVFLIVF